MSRLQNINFQKKCIKTEERRKKQPAPIRFWGRLFSYVENSGVPSEFKVRAWLVWHPSLRRISFPLHLRRQAWRRNWPVRHSLLVRPERHSVPPAEVSAGGAIFSVLCVSFPVSRLAGLRPADLPSADYFPTVLPAVVRLSSNPKPLLMSILSEQKEETSEPEDLLSYSF